MVPIINLMKNICDGDTLMHVDGEIKFSTQRDKRLE